MNQADRRVLLLERKREILRSRASLIPFARYMSPDPDHRVDPNYSSYEVARHHRVIGAALEEVEAGRIKRLMISCPPRHGKTKLASMLFPTWAVGRNPRKSIVFATYNDKFAQDIGGVVKTTMQSPLYKHVFPKLDLRYGGAANDRLRILDGGDLFFVGVGGTLTGRGGDINILDDPIKNRQEADSPIVREKLWNWYNNVLRYRMMTQDAALVIIACMTGDTPVLMEDGYERLLRDIRSGDRVVSYDQRAGKLTSQIVLNWINHGPDKVFAIRTKSGSVVKANARHPFLVDNEGVLEWRRTGLLKKGDKILRVTGESGRGRLALWTTAKAVSPARACAHPTITKLAGRVAFGRLRSTLAHSARRILNTVTASLWPNTMSCSSSRAVYALFARLTAVPAGHGIGSQISFPTTTTKPGDFAVFCATTVTGSPVEPETQPSWSAPPNTSELATDVVESVTDAGVEDVFDIQVEKTENFIANFLISHNTRWNEDDIIGRHTDPTNPYYNEEEAATWSIINLPALAEEDDPLGRPIDQPLWPTRFGTEFLLDQRRADARGFTALYQGRPTPAEGSFFKSDFIRTYNKMSDLPHPDSLRYYGASDLAVATKQENDKSCHMVVGVDENDNIWIMPDLVWTRLPSDMSVEAVINLMAKYRPMLWWGEKGAISKSIGPFLRKRMLEKRVFCSIDEITPIADKQSRAQSISARMNMGRVYFPRFTRWFADARDQLLKFPHSGFDDFVDTLSLIGLGLMKQVPARGKPKAREGAPKEFTLGWVKENSKRAEREARSAMDGW